MPAPTIDQNLADLRPHLAPSAAAFPQLIGIAKDFFGMFFSGERDGCLENV
jgi:hypothetical protein